MNVNYNRAGLAHCSSQFAHVCNDILLLRVRRRSGGRECSPLRDHVVLQILYDEPRLSRLELPIGHSSSFSRAPSRRRATRPPKQRGERELSAMATERRARTRQRILMYATGFPRTFILIR